MDENIKQTYTIGIDKTYPSKNGYDVNLEEARPSLDIVWSSITTQSEALEVFLKFIKKQSIEYHDLKAIKVWKTIRLYDETGKQIRQES